MTYWAEPHGTFRIKEPFSTSIHQYNKDWSRKKLMAKDKYSNSDGRYFVVVLAAGVKFHSL